MNRLFFILNLNCLLIYTSDLFIFDPVDEHEDIKSINSKLLKPPIHLISPDMEDKSSHFQVTIYSV